ncbi:hypothetical protein [Pontibacter populi]|uniref:CPBP family intramembrane metalloprotease n=1 Tax=Pontibacter populi TaxID=890055 RepID=A0ABV1RUL4_9BACT
MLKTFTANLKQTASDLLSFLRKPTDSPETDMPTKGKLRELLNMIIIKALIAIVFSGLIWLIQELGLYKIDGHAMEGMLRNKPVWEIILLGIVLIPLLEEIIFRFGLRFRRGYFTFLLLVVLLAIGVYAFKMMPLMWALTIIFLSSVLMVLYLIKAYAIGEFLERIWPRVYGMLFYGVAITFGLVHIFNYSDFDFTSLAVLLIPVLIGSQIWGGLSMGYMRVKYGFAWGFFLHAAHNAVFMIPGLLFINQLEEKLNVNNDTYSLTVEEHFYYDRTLDSKRMISVDTAAFVNTKLNEVIVHLIQAEDVSIVNNTGSNFTPAVNLYYKSETADLAKTNKTILSELQKLYKFDITKANVEKEMWDVEVENNTALAASASDRGGITSEVTIDKKGIEMHNVTIEQLISTLQNEYSVAMADKTTDAGRYNFTFSKKGFEELKEELKGKYGLVLQSKMIEAQQVLVEFRK